MTCSDTEQRTTATGAMEVEQKSCPIAAAAAEATQPQLASTWLSSSTPVTLVELLAQRHNLTQQQLQVLLTVQRKVDAKDCWRIITIPQSAGVLAGHLIVELRQPHAQPEQQLDAKHTTNRCVYAPCGAALPAKEAQLLIAEHVASTQDRLKQLEQPA